jgi:hypothetical protein
MARAPGEPDAAYREAARKMVLEIAAEGQGVMSVSVIRHGDLDALGRADPHRASMAMSAAFQILEARMWCVLCDAEMEPEDLDGVALIHAEVDKPGQLMACGVCGTCCGKHDRHALLHRVGAILVPKGRRFTLSPGKGTA